MPAKARSSGPGGRFRAEHPPAADTRVDRVNSKPLGPIRRKLAAASEYVMARPRITQLRRARCEIYRAVRGLARSPRPGRPWLLIAAAAGVLAAAVTAIALAQEPRPPTPAGLSGQGLGGGRVRLDWVDVAAANGYQVRMWAGDAWQVLPGDGIGLTLGDTSADVFGLSTGSYQFSVRAIGSEALSDWSDAVTLQIARIQRQPPVEAPDAGAKSQPARMPDADAAAGPQARLNQSRPDDDSAAHDSGTAGLDAGSRCSGSRLDLCDRNRPRRHYRCGRRNRVGDLPGAGT